MLSIWPENQPMSRVADFACCAILDFRSPCGNDYSNQEMPSGMSTAAKAATDDLTAEAVLQGFGSGISGRNRSGIEHRGGYRYGYLGQMGSRTRADFGKGRAAGIGSGTNPPQQRTGLGHTAKQPNGNR